jgi:hypothetical protein
VKNVIADHESHHVSNSVVQKIAKSWQEKRTTYERSAADEKATDFTVRRNQVLPEEEKPEERQGRREE